jgi:hypothetical protein
MALDDVWNSAQHVRMWLETANQNLGSASSKTAGSVLAGWLSRGRTSKANIDEAIDALGKVKLACLDLEFALHRAEMDRVDLATLKLQVVNAPSVLFGRVVIKDDAVAAVQAAVVADLSMIDALVAGVEAMQRAERQ